MTKSGLQTMEFQQSLPEHHLPNLDELRHELDEIVRSNKERKLRYIKEISPDHLEVFDKPEIMQALLDTDYENIVVLNEDQSRRILFGEPPLEMQTLGVGSKSAGRFTIDRVSRLVQPQSERWVDFMFRAKNVLKTVDSNGETEPGSYEGERTWWNSYDSDERVKLLRLKAGHPVAIVVTPRVYMLPQHNPDVDIAAMISKLSQEFGSFENTIYLLHPDTLSVDDLNTEENWHIRTE